MLIKLALCLVKFQKTSTTFVEIEDFDERRLFDMKYFDSKIFL